MIHPHTEVRFINEEIGYGLVAKQLIPKGTIIWILDELDREFTPGQINQMHSHIKSIVENYTYRNNKGNYVLCWDNGRFMNHSFNANCISTPYNFEIATRDIFPGEQLTDDYGYLNIIEPFKAADEGTEREFVYPDDLTRFHKVWDGVIQGIFPLIVKKEQPLMPFINQGLWNKIKEIASGEKALDSILLNYFKGAGKKEPGERDLQLG